MALAGCASVNAVPLSANGERVGTVEGIRYYMPAPYLLVTDLPVSPKDAATDVSTAQTGGSGTSRGGTATGSTGSTSSPKAGGGDAGTKDQTTAAAPAAPSTDTSFQALTSGHLIKLVYLPDLSHPMALQMRTGIFGNAAFAPTLQDGWMLTNLNGSADSGGPQTLQALASILGSVGSMGVGGAPAVAAQGKKSAPSTPLQSFVTEAIEGKAILDPRAAEELDKIGQNIGRGIVAPYTAADLQNFQAHPEILRKLSTGIRKGLGVPQSNLTISDDQLFAYTIELSAIADLKSTHIPADVLPAGLYKFEYDPEGIFTGLKAVSFFCRSGVDSPSACAD